MSSLLKAKSLNFNYVTSHILKNIHLDIEPGTFTSILGPNGSGKTTLLKNLCGVLKPQYGEITLHDKPIELYSTVELAQNMAVIHQSSDVHFDFSIYDIVMMGRYSHMNFLQSATDLDYHIVQTAMLETDTWNIKDKSIYEISGGEKQRVIIARSLAQQSGILLLDEPINHLDLKHQISILSLIKTLSKEKNLAVLTTLHDINMAARFSDSIVLLNNGKVVTKGSPQRVLTKEHIERIYDIEVTISEDHNGNPYIIPN
ncbi:MAG: heme ABC transporter ATP-binding protein [Fibrobacterales bacterium]